MRALETMRDWLLDLPFMLWEWAEERRLRRWLSGIPATENRSRFVGVPFHQVRESRKSLPPHSFFSGDRVLGTGAGFLRVSSDDIPPDFARVLNDDFWEIV